MRHGKSKTPIYKKWEDMKQRCYNPNHPLFKYYGAKGIVPCIEWNDFNNFYQDMGDHPEGLELERRNVLKGYYKENCMWATRSQQLSNRNSFGSSGVLGVSKVKSGRYRARINFNGKEHVIGTFDTPYLASLAYHACRSVIYPELYET